MTNISGFTPTYDADGNVTSDPLMTRTFDADDFLVGGGGTSVTIDALGRAIDSGFLTATFYSPDGLLKVYYQAQVARLAKLQLPGGGFATYDEGNGGLISYSHPDHLGSIRLTTNPSRAFVSSRAHAPFGERYASSDGNGGYFTGQSNFFNLDTYEFPAREYVDQGRWASPDPAGLAAANLAFPQSWNRYAYVMNNPLANTDPLGLCDGQGDYPDLPCPSDNTVAVNGGDAPTYLTCDGIVSSDAGCVPQSYQPWLFPRSTGGGGGGGILNGLKKAVNAVCSATPDAVSAGAGGDAGLGIVGSGQLNLTANGSSGELTLSLSMGLSGGIIGPDAYLSGSVTPSAPDNSFLDTHGQPSKSYGVGVGRVGYSGGGGTYGATYGPSLLPVTLAVQLMLSKPIATVPYIGYLAHPVRAVCKAIGH